MLGPFRILVDAFSHPFSHTGTDRRLRTGPGRSTGPVRGPDDESNIMTVT